MRQQQLFSLKTSTVSGQPAIGGDNPVAGDDDGYRVEGIGTPDCSRGARRLQSPAKPLSPAMLDWMCRIQEGGVRMATDEEYRKSIAARLF